MRCPHVSTVHLQGRRARGGDWIPLVLTSNSRYEATGLDALTYYAFRLCAIGASVKSPMSQAATALSIGPLAA